MTRSFGRGNRLINCDPYFIQKVEIISPVLSNSALPRSQIQDRSQAGVMADFHTSTLPDFDPPGNLPDLNAETRQVWSNKFISYWMTGEIEANTDVTIQKRTPLQQYFNGTIVPFDTTQKPNPVTWTAFPKRVCKLDCRSKGE